MKLITHNAYWFQGFPPVWGQEKVAAAPVIVNALTRLYSAIKPDILCLQEVQDPKIVERIANRLGMDQWIHTQAGRMRHYRGAILCRDEARFLDLTQKGDPAHERVHCRASLQWNDHLFTLAMIHLPSNRYADSPQVGDANRIAELRRVLDTPPRPDCIVGDFNCTPGSPPYQILLDSGYVDVALHWPKGLKADQRVDYIWVDAAQSEYVQSFSLLNGESFTISLAEGVTAKLSDHPPLCVELADVGR